MTQFLFCKSNSLMPLIGVVACLLLTPSYSMTVPSDHSNCVIGACCLRNSDQLPPVFSKDSNYRMSFRFKYAIDMATVPRKQLSRFSVQVKNLSSDRAKLYMIGYSGGFEESKVVESIIEQTKFQIDDNGKVSIDNLSFGSPKKVIKQYLKNVNEKVDGGNLYLRKVICRPDKEP